MEALSINQFNEYVNYILDLADNVDELLVHRDTRKYLIIPIHDDAPSVTPELQKLIDEIHQEVADGKYIRLSSEDDIERFVREA